MKFLFISFLIFYSYSSLGQVNEPVTDQVYAFLYRMAEKGLIELNDYQTPLDRHFIYLALKQVQTFDSLLSNKEDRELNFYLKDFVFDNPDIEDANERVSLLKKDSAGRFRTALFKQGGYKIFLDPLLGMNFLSSSGKNNRTYFGGVRLAGYFGKHFGFNFSFRDITETGDSINRSKSFTPEQGIVNIVSTNNSVNYSAVDFNIGYVWNKGSLNIGKDKLTWGYGKAGNILLSGKAPSYPYIKFNLRPWKWFHFDYFHGWLASDIIDSARSYQTSSGGYNGTRIIYRSKFIANHSITLTPLKGLRISLGESIVYSDKINIAYLIPVNFFRAYDHYASNGDINSGNNSQFFGFISSRNHLKNTHLYAQVFIDEIKISKIFDKVEKRNQIAYTFGFENTDLLVKYLSVGAEYSRVNPFVYNNLIATQTYTSHSYSLGDWMGNNADRVYVYAKYTPVPKLKLTVCLQNIRKGPAGTLQQQYNQQPQPAFLSQQLFLLREVGAMVSYEWINTAELFLKINSTNWKYPSTSNKATGLNVGFSYGL